jgi:anti-sigma B factor antagonist
MRLTLDSQKFDKILVIRCKGRITFGAEIEALEAEVYKRTQINDVFVIKDVVLQLAETEYIDSSGLGTLIRLLGVFRAAGGSLKLCQLSQSVAKVIQVTNLQTLFPLYATEAEAIGAHRPRHAGDELGLSKTRIVCIDTSSNLLAGLKALLTRSGYGVFTTRFVGEASILVRAIGPQLVICGPGMLEVPTGPSLIERFRQSGRYQILQLPPDFHSAEAGQAGQELVSQVRSLVPS